MKNFEEPEKIQKNKKLNLEEIRDKVADEGLGFCIFEYIMPAQIEDQKLATLWKEAKLAMRRVKLYVYGDKE